ncbi:hypothetical protein A2U01_0085535, partial [Trifolium medium]|nr:hypothetical protein [Trifolium medium]
RQGKLTLDQRLLTETHVEESAGPFVQRQAGALTWKRIKNTRIIWTRGGL